MKINEIKLKKWKVLQYKYNDQDRVCYILLCNVYRGFKFDFLESAWTIRCKHWLSYKQINQFVPRSYNTSAENFDCDSSILHGHGI